MLPIDDVTIDALLEEIRRYLGAVDLFRREGCTVRWIDAPLTDEAAR
jgi:hypothetical protein